MFKIHVTIYNIVFRESDEKKIEMKDERGIKEENIHNLMFFVLFQSIKSYVFDLIRK